MIMSLLLCRVRHGWTHMPMLPVVRSCVRPHLAGGPSLAWGQLAGIGDALKKVSVNIVCCGSGSEVLNVAQRVSAKLARHT